jgi:hypothetical protein
MFGGNDTEGQMRHRWMWRLFGLIAGGFLGVVVVMGGTHGISGESSEERMAEQSFFWIPLYDLRGSPEEVRAIERGWAARLYSAGAILGGAIGLAGAICLTRRRT